MTSMNPIKQWRLAVCIVLAALLTACAGARAYREGNALLNAGQTGPGLAQLAEAVRLEPDNAGYRIALVNRRAAILSGYLGAADVARREGRSDDAERAYRQLLALEPNHLAGHQGLAASQQERTQRRDLQQVEALLGNGSDAALEQAGVLLRPVLEGPPHSRQLRQAMSLKQRLTQALAPRGGGPIRLGAAYRKPVTLEFRDAPLKAILEFVSRQTGINVFYDKDLRADVRASILARQTSVDDALRLILATSQLDYRVLNENSILVYPATAQKIKDYQALTVRSFYLTNADPKAVANTIKTIVKTRDLTVDERLGMIIMRDTPQAVRMAERIVALQDLSDPEVMLEVEILEVKRSRLLELGVQWPGRLQLSPLQRNGLPLTLRELGQITSATTQAQINPMVINANQTDGDVNVLANPRIRVRNKERARVQIGERLPIITTTANSTGFVAESVTYLDVGLKLEVEPNIHLNDEVAIKINLEVSTLGAQVTSKSGTTAYQIGTRGASTVLRLQDGETQVLAGLIQDSDRASGSKIPWLGDIPLLGRLFGSQRDDNERNEILLSITPRILRSVQRPDLLQAEFESGTESNIGGDTLQMLAQSVRPARAVEQAPAPAPASDAAPADPPAPAVAATAATDANPVQLTWQAPASVKRGSRFHAVLRIDSRQPLRDIAVRIGFDTHLLRVVAVAEGDFFRQGRAATVFQHRIGAAQGSVSVNIARPDDDGRLGPVSGAGELLVISFEALAPGAGKVELLEWVPEPAGQGLPPALPLGLKLQVLP